MENIRLLRQIWFLLNIRQKQRKKFSFVVVRIQKKSPSVMEHIPKFNFFSFQEKINDEDICIDFLRKPSLNFRAYKGTSARYVN
jgi:hypothetical protein